MGAQFAAVAGLLVAAEGGEEVQRSAVDVYVAIAISVVGAAPGGWLPHWLAVDVLWRLACGLLVGSLTGWALRALFFSAPSEKFRLAEHAEGFVALAGTLFAGLRRTTSVVRKGP